VPDLESAIEEPVGCHRADHTSIAMTGLGKSICGAWPTFLA
jgi:hypothetical protein